MELQDESLKQLTNLAWGHSLLAGQKGHLALVGLATKELQSSAPRQDQVAVVYMEKYLDPAGESI